MHNVALKTWVQHEVRCVQMKMQMKLQPTTYVNVISIISVSRLLDVGCSSRIHTVRRSSQVSDTVRFYGRITDNSHP